MTGAVIDARNRFVGTGVYTVPQAARLIGAPSNKVRRWIFGGRGQKSIIEPDYEPIDGVNALSFHDLIEARFIRAFREKGVSFQHLRKVASKAREDLKTVHPFASAKFVTDGRRIILDEIDEAGRRSLVDYLNDQRNFEHLVRDTILDGVSFDACDLAETWQPRAADAPGIIIDPRRAFGAPILARTGIRSEVIARSAKAEGSLSAVALAFGITEAEVKQALLFEERLAA
ncbi:DUF433 domain-containing protein [Caulobacter sp. RL271]|uniref:DUF433 domain-containing protein n=1 Tax=Caulobacter segnis TaxID=88688 RepID=A0ABY4ZUF2_9CAUL|nr:DUF433 domain-containing protein [Caulobacter segnis]USQ95834.1 DUF433 domain-containing protein [Caulobacter segnis]